MATTLDEVWALFRETDRKFQETDQRMKETDQRMKETDRQIGALGEIQADGAALRRCAGDGRSGRDGDPERGRPLRLPTGPVRAGAERRNRGDPQ